MGLGGPTFIIPATIEAEAGGCLGFTGQPSQQVNRPVTDRVSMNKVGEGQQHRLSFGVH